MNPQSRYFRRGASIVVLVAVAAVVTGGVVNAAVGAQESTTTAASTMQIAIHCAGPSGQIRHQQALKCTVESLKGMVSLENIDSGRAAISNGPSNAPKFVGGQQHWPDSGTYLFTGKKGTLGWSFKGNWIPLNPRLTRSGAVSSFTNARGAWKVTTGTGIFQGWKGGGLYASVAKGTIEGGTMDAEFDGHIRH